MKQLYIYIIVLLTMFSFASCEKDETKLEVLPIAEVNAPELNMDGSKDYITEISTLNIYPSVLTWTKSNFGNALILGTYTLQIDTTPDFKTKIEKSVGVNTFSYALSGSELNSWGVTFNVEKSSLEKVNLYIRVGSSVYVNSPTSIVNKPDTVFSEQIAIAVTPMLIEMPFLYVPGDHQGWAPATAPKIYSPLRDNVYTGYIYLNKEFKIAVAPNWDGVVYGAGSSTGTLSSDKSSGNITSTPGYYWLSADIPALTYDLTPVQWSIMGTAVGDIDVKMKYDTNLKVLCDTIPMVAGNFKFRRNASWDINLGGTGVEGALEQNGADISVATSGSYIIKLDLSNVENYNYSIKAE